MRDDVLANPEKYEKLLTNLDYTTDVYDPVKIKEKMKEEEYDYWYRIINDGRLPKDNIRDYQQL